MVRHLSPAVLWPCLQWAAKLSHQLLLWILKQKSLADPYSRDNIRTLQRNPEVNKKGLARDLIRVSLLSQRQFLFPRPSREFSAFPTKRNKTTSSPRDDLWEHLSVDTGGGGFHPRPYSVTSLFFLKVKCVTTTFKCNSKHLRLFIMFGDCTFQEKIKAQWGSTHL